MEKPYIRIEILTLNYSQSSYMSKNNNTNLKVKLLINKTLLLNLYIYGLIWYPALGLCEKIKHKQNPSFPKLFTLLRLSNVPQSQN